MEQLLKTLALVASFISFAPAFAQPGPAVENPRAVDLKFRGQGPNDICYSFAEEQFLKDKSCDENCDYNSAEWVFSIFDIARAHQKLRLISDPSIASENLDVELLSTGSSTLLPYERAGIISVRKSACTLERDLLLLNRSSVLNPAHKGMPGFIAQLYVKLNSKVEPTPQLDGFDIQQSWKILKNLAVTSNNAKVFLAKAIDYSKCSDRVEIPKVKLRGADPADPKVIRELITNLLSSRKSLFVKVCSEVLQNEAGDDGRCGRHAVVLKAVSEDYSLVRVVDSAFFSRRPRSVDGSIWIPTDVVVKAIAKFKDQGLLNDPDLSPLLTKLADSLAGLFIALVRPVVENLTDQDFHAMIPGVIRSLSVTPVTSQVKEAIAGQVERMQLKTKANLDQLEKIARKEILREMVADKRPPQDRNGINWIE